MQEDHRREVPWELSGRPAAEGGFSSSSAGLRACENEGGDISTGGLKKKKEPGGGGDGSGKLAFIFHV
jgi:hypothetical protein